MHRMVILALLLVMAACGSRGVGPGPIEECSPEDIAQCVCPDGESGTQTCQTDGTYGPCECTEPGCIPGDRLGCACPDGERSTQTCQADGTYGSCDCAHTGCVPGRSIGCTCQDGADGAQTCNPDGTWGECECVEPGCSVGESLPCVCTDGESGTQECLADGTYGDCVCSAGCAPGDLFCLLQEAMVGTWEGTATPPTAWSLPYGVRIVFEADGHYAAQCTDDNCVAFYYGSDADSAEKTYELVDLQANDTGVAEIRVYFGTGNTTTGTLSDIWIQDDQLTFDFWATWLSPHTGPIVYTLDRVL